MPSINFSLLLLHLIFGCQILNGQNIIYRPVLINQCTGKKIDSVMFYLTDEKKTIIYDSSNSEIKLAKLNKYFLYTNYSKYSSYALNSYEVKLNIGINYDTFYTPLVKRGMWVSNPYEQFSLCGEPANGKIKDVYKNNILRLKGTFLNGLPIDSVCVYSSKSKLVKLDIPNTKTDSKNKGQYKVSTLFFENGAISKESDYSKKYEKIYFKSRQLKAYHNWKNIRQYSKKEYYTNGQLNLFQDRIQRIRFDYRGKIMEHTTRKLDISLNNLFEKKYYNYKSNFFDSLGNKIYEIHYYGPKTSLRHPEYFLAPFKQIELFQFKRVNIFEKGLLKKLIEFKRTYVGDSLKTIPQVFIIENNKKIEVSKNKDFDLISFLKLPIFED
jgi:hypothetical protein